jgi:hypothetical protein
MKMNEDRNLPLNEDFHRVLARIMFKRAKKHVATTMTAVSGRYVFSEVSKTSIFLQ